MMALKNLGVAVTHKFACDVDKNAKATIFANFPPEVWYDDLMARDNRKAPPVSLYVAGFPCQPFSAGGKGQGFKDERGRGTIFFGVLQYITTQMPTTFVLENVKGLVTRNGGKYFKAVMAALEEIGKYNLYWQVLNTLEHGVPQNRERCYIVGIRKNVDDGTFAFPEKLAHVSVEEFLDPRKGRPSETDLPPKSSTTAHKNVKDEIKRLEKEGNNPLLRPYLIDCDSTAGWMTNRFDGIMCMTRRRPRGHWISNRGRYTNCNEMMRLQGMRPDNFVQAVSPYQLGCQIGNAMSVNVLERLFVRLLPAARLVPVRKLHDRFAAAAVGPAPSTPKRKGPRPSRSRSPVKQQKRALRRAEVPAAKAARTS